MSLLDKCVDGFFNNMSNKKAHFKCKIHGKLLSVELILEPNTAPISFIPESRAWGHYTIDDVYLPSPHEVKSNVADYILLRVAEIVEQSRILSDKKTHIKQYLRAVRRSVNMSDNLFITGKHIVENMQKIEQNKEYLKEICLLIYNIIEKEQK